ncbi:hypothetical protein KM043_002126 [Ampulex compressa]|nr:hypothetical protein KM043_002126 [Ampulex compressa]
MSWAFDDDDAAAGICMRSSPPAHRRGPRRVFRSSRLHTRHPLTHVVLLCPVSHVNLRRGPRKEETPVQEGPGGRRRLTSKRRIGGCCGLECPLLG